jgi:hypothetical protein
VSKLSGAESDLDPSWTMASAAVYLQENSVHAEKMGRLAMAAEMRPRSDSVAMHRVELREWLVRAGRSVGAVNAELHVKSSDCIQKGTRPEIERAAPPNG